MGRRRTRPARVAVNATVCALAALAKLDRPATTAEVARVAGYTTRRLRTVLPALVAAGLVCLVPAPCRTWTLP